MSSRFVRSAPAFVLALSALAAACSDGAPEGPTYHGDIAPLFAKNCVACHAQGGIAPFALDSYAAVKQYAPLVKSSVVSRKMPPSNLDNSGSCQSFQDVRWLSDADIALVSSWVDGGLAEGKAPAEPAKVTPDHLGDDALTVKMAEAYLPQPSEKHPNDDYRCFILDPQLAEDAFMNGYEIVPGQRSEVHHMLLFALTSDAADAAAQQLDDENEGYGFPCFGAAGVDDVNLLAAWAPGKDVFHYPAGTGIKMKKGHNLVMQIHYNLLAGKTPDVTTLKLSKEASVAKEAALAPLGPHKFTLDPGQKEATAGTKFILGLLGKPEIELHGVLPHMHLAGRTLSYSVSTVGDTSDAQCLAKVAKWDFNWQSLEFYKTPVILNSNQQMNVDCTYDTTGRETVTKSGEGTQDEMCLVFSYVTLPNGGPLGL